MSGTLADAVYLNVAANDRAAAAKWVRVAQHFAGVPTLAAHRHVELGTPDAALDAWVRAQANNGARRFVAAGGDGTVNAMANALFRAERRDALQLGAVGIGSSNDYHKPCHERLADLPARLDFPKAQPADVGVLTLDACSPHIFLVNSSIGAIAAGADAMNRPGQTMAWLKRNALPIAMAVAGVGVLARHTPVPGSLTIDGVTQTVSLAVLTIARKAAFGGGMRYDEEPVPGRLGVYVTPAAGTARNLSLLVTAHLGRFSKLGYGQTYMARNVTLALDAATVVEADGETSTARQITWHIEPAALNLCP